MPSQQERRDKTIASLVEAGHELMSRRGYDAVSVDEVVARAGVAKGAFYHHFRSKAALLDRLVDDLQAQIAGELAERRVPGVLTAEGLAAALEHYVRLATRPDRVRVLMVDGPAVLGLARWRDIDDRHFAAMTKDGVAQIMGSEDDAAIDAATRLVLGAVMEAVLDTARSADPDATATVYGQQLRRLLGGLAKG